MKVSSADGTEVELSAAPTTRLERQHVVTNDTVFASIVAQPISQINEIEEERKETADYGGRLYTDSNMRKPSSQDSHTVWA